MADYVPLYLPGKAVNSTASATIAGGQAVYVSGSGTVAPANAAANIPVGIAAQDAASGAYVGYFARGTVHRLTASGTVTAGDLVEAAAAGAVATHTVGTNDGRVFGIALTTATTGNSVEIMEV
jgi:predicted RecA/RadA family phage recombinase